MGLTVAKQQEVRDSYYKLCENVPEWVFAYLAGFLDGEGSIMADRRKVYNKNQPNRNGHQSPTISVKVCNTDPRPLYLFQKHFGGKLYKEPEVKNSHRNKEIYSYRAHINSSWVLLEKLLPYLIVKQEQANIALQLYKHLATLAVNQYKTDPLIPKLVEEVARLNSRHHVKDLGNYTFGKKPN
jgi:hypothetical protein